jgi:hypothetical protein
MSATRFHNVALSLFAAMLVATACVSAAIQPALSLA